MAKYLWNFFLNYVQMMAIDNLRKHMIFSALLNFNIKNLEEKIKIKATAWHHRRR
jgi:hypothetical protein